MNTSRFLRVVLAASLPVASASNSWAGPMVVGSVGTAVSPSVGAGPIIQTGISQPALGAGIQTGAPITSLGSSLPGLIAPNLTAGGLTAPGVPAALTPIPGLLKARPSASLAQPFSSRQVPRDGIGLPREVARPASLTSALGLTSVLSAGKSAAVAPKGSRGKSASLNAAHLGALFDGSGVRSAIKDGEAVAATGKAAEQEDPLDMWFGRAVAKKMMRSEIYTNIGLIKGSGSEFYWNKFVRDVPVRVLVGGRMMYFTRIIKGTTKEIGKLRRKDFEGYYSNRIVNGKTNGKFNNTLPELRNRLLGEMRKKAYYSDNGPRAVTPHTKVRLVQFMSFKEARHLPENNNEPDMEARLRKPVEIPDAVNGLHNILPRMVLIDLDLLGDRIPFDLLEDMGKLQKAGVTFVLLSKKSQDEVDKIIVRDLSLRQRDNVVRWKLFSLANDGNTLYQYGGSFSQLIKSVRFGELELEALNRAAEATRSGVVETSKGYGITMRPKRGFLAEELVKELTSNISRFGLKEDRYALTLDESGTVTIRPRTLGTAMRMLISGMQTEAGIYLNNEHIMTVTQDDSIMEQLPGGLHFTQKAPKVKDADMVETSLAAMLGPYRKNVQGDLAASASSLKSFKAGYMNDADGFRYKIYMLLGHVLHTAMDWAIMVYNDTGRLPSKEAVREKAHEIWKHEANQQIANLLEHPGESLAGYMEAMDRRLNDMHALTADMLKAYPIVLGTELSNLHVVERFGKDGQVARRDIFRGLYDLVLAREVAGGLEVVVADFKTGQTPTIPLLGKDTQVLLYDFFARKLWPSVPTPYNIGNAMKKMMNHLVAFIYPSGIESPEITEWDRLWFEKFLVNIMKRLRKFKGVVTQEQIDKEARKAELQIRRAAREAKKPRTVEELKALLRAIPGVTTVQFRDGLAGPMATIHFDSVESLRRAESMKLLPKNLLVKEGRRKPVSHTVTTAVPREDAKRVEAEAFERYLAQLKAIPGVVDVEYFAGGQQTGPIFEPVFDSPEALEKAKAAELLPPAFDGISNIDGRTVPGRYAVIPKVARKALERLVEQHRKELSAVPGVTKVEVLDGDGYMNGPSFKVEFDSLKALNSARKKDLLPDSLQVHDTSYEVSAEVAP